MFRSIVLTSCSFLVATFASGCHRDKSDSRDVVPEPQAEDAITNLEQVTPISLADPDCQKEGTGLATMGKQTLWRYVGAGVSKQEVDLSALRSDGPASGLGLRGGVVLGSLFGFQQSSSGQCQVTSTDVTCSENNDAKASGGYALRICRNDIFQRNSIEAVTLGVAATLNEAASTYEREALGGQKLSPLIALVLPNIYTDYSIQRGNRTAKGRLTKTDNASWSMQAIPNDGGTSHQGLIAMYPSSETFARKNSAGVLGLWEIPFVAAHEFGHHAFYHNVASFKRLTDDRASQGLAPLRDDSWRAQTETIRKQIGGTILDDLFRPSRRADAEKREVTSTDVLLGFNEAFADLFAFIHTGGASESLALLPQLCQNRDVKRDSFEYAGVTTPKTLSVGFLQTFLSSDKVKAGGPDTSGCAAVDPQSAYTLSAVVSHGFVSLTEGRSDRLAVLIRWTRALDTLFVAPDQAPSLFLAKGVRALVAEISASNPLDPAQCAKANAVFDAALDTETRSQAGCR